MTDFEEVFVFSLSFFPIIKWKRRTDGSFFFLFQLINLKCPHIPEDINLSTMYIKPLGLVFHRHRKAYL